MIFAHNALVERIGSHLRGSDTAARWPAAVGGSDAHSLRRVGRTWTEAPARAAGEFLEAMKNGRARVGGDNGGVRAVAGDAYGVILRYYDSLLGLGPSDHDLLHRCGCLAFSIAALPAQFLPSLIAALGKRCEATNAADAAPTLPPWLEREFDTTAGLEISEERV